MPQVQGKESAQMKNVAFFALWCVSVGLNPDILEVPEIAATIAEKDGYAAMQKMHNWGYNFLDKRGSYPLDNPLYKLEFILFVQRFGGEMRTVQYSDKELSLIKHFNCEGLIENLTPTTVYDSMMEKAFLSNEQSPYAEALRRCMRALFKNSTQRNTPEWDALIGDIK